MLFVPACWRINILMEIISTVFVVEEISEKLVLVHKKNIFLSNVAHIYTVRRSATVWRTLCVEIFFRGAYGSQQLIKAVHI